MSRLLTWLRESDELMRRLSVDETPESSSVLLLAPFPLSLPIGSCLYPRPEEEARVVRIRIRKHVLRQ